jgi:hypothetical protein
VRLALVPSRKFRLWFAWWNLTIELDFWDYGGVEAAIVRTVRKS